MVKEKSVFRELSRYMPDREREELLAKLKKSIYDEESYEEKSFHRDIDRNQREELITQDLNTISWITRRRPSEQRRTYRRPRPIFAGRQAHYWNITGSRWFRSDDSPVEPGTAGGWRPAAGDSRSGLQVRRPLASLDGWSHSKGP